MYLSKYRSGKYLRGDTTLLLVTVGLCLFGLLMVSSASVVISYEQFGSNTFYLIKQAIALLIGIIFMVVTSLIDYKFWKKSATILFLISLFLTIIVFIPGLGPHLGGARRWLSIGPILVQPSEIMKIAFVVYLSAWLESKGKNILSIRQGVIPFAVVLTLAILLIIKQPDMGTALVITACATTIFFVAGANIVHIISASSFGVFSFYLLIRSSSYRWERLLTFLNPKADLQGTGYQINQALLAIGSGGWLGLGFGQSRQKYLYLPQSQTDAIFAIIVEELGFLRVVPLILAFVYLGYKGYKIAKHSPDLFSKLLATGITTWIIFQAFVNIGGIMGIIPLTGIPLPFISYGGSSLVTLLGAMGILYNISRHTENYK